MDLHWPCRMRRNRTPKPGGLSSNPQGGVVPRCREAAAQAMPSVGLMATCAVWMPLVGLTRLMSGGTASKLTATGHQNSVSLIGKPKPNTRLNKSSSNTKSDALPKSPAALAREMRHPPDLGSRCRVGSGGLWKRGGLR